MLSALLLLVGSSVALAGGAVTASYAATLGGPGHAGMYPSGMEIVPTDSTTTAAGTAGNVVVADTGNDRVAEYTTSGSLVWQTNASGVANEGSSAPCGTKPGFPQFEQPRDVGVDSSGNVYVADNGNGRIVVLNAATGKCLEKPFKMVGRRGADRGDGEHDPRRPAGLCGQRDPEPGAGLHDRGGLPEVDRLPGCLHHQECPRRGRGLLG